MADAPAPASDADPSTWAPQPEIPDPGESTTATSATPPEAGGVSSPLSDEEPVPVVTGLDEPDLSSTADAPVVSEPASSVPVPAAEPLPASPDSAASPVSPAAPGYNAVPEVAATLDVPAAASPAGDGGDGGEWEVLVQKVRHWLASGQLQQQWQSARGPLSLLAGLIALLLVLRVYGALLAVLDSLPLVPGLLELVGVIAITRFSLTRLLRSNERQAVINDLQQRWQAFRGKA